MANPNFAAEQREMTIALYNNVNRLFERAQRMFEGVYFEIFVEPRVPELGTEKRFIIHLVDMESDRQNESIMALDANPALKERLSRIERLQENYKILMDTAHETLEKVREEYPAAQYKINFIRRRQELELEPVQELEAEFDTDSEGNEEDLESNWDSESDWNSEPDSGLDSETDTQSEIDLHSDAGSEPDSGMD